MTKFNIAGVILSMYNNIIIVDVVWLFWEADVERRAL